MRKRLIVLFVCMLLVGSLTAPSVASAYVRGDEVWHGSVRGQLFVHYTDTRPGESKNHWYVQKMHINIWHWYPYMNGYHPGLEQVGPVEIWLYSPKSRLLREYPPRPNFHRKTSRSYYLDPMQMRTWR